MKYVICNPIDSFEGHHIPMDLVVSRNTIPLVGRGVANKEDRSEISAQQVFPDPCDMGYRPVFIKGACRYRR